ncbi:hypothetical protein FRC11_011132 [Ceratobasidium sp. 423]|nr:hypothetical protein FRC11_011132 [Ceratobasidium sp. 423]
MAQHPPNIATDAALAAADSDIVISSPGTTYQSTGWWRHAQSVNSRSVTDAERTDVEGVSLFGKQCLITCEKSPACSIQMAHLIAKSSKLYKLVHLQYTFGRKVNPNSRWFNLFLKSDIHIAFDASPSGWALVPVWEVIEQIKDKIDGYELQRKRDSIHGPWPDFRRSDWFPARRSGYTYQFIPLNYLPEGVTVSRIERWDGGEPIYQRHRPPYSNFPILKSHIHPYAAILNAVPKLQQNLTRLPLVPGLWENLPKLLHIYSRLTEARKDEPAAPRNQQGATPRPPPGSATPRSMATRSLTRVPVHPSSQEAPAISTTNTHVDSTEPNDSDDPLDDFNSEGSLLWSDASSHLSLSTPTPNDSILSDGEANHTPSPLFATLASTRRQEIAEWVVSVDHARQQNELAEPESDNSPGCIRYAAEPARSSPTQDWHSWTSKFAPWWVLLPEPKERGVISSNDWAEIRNRPPLTRRVDLPLTANSFTPVLSHA